MNRIEGLVNRRESMLRVTRTQVYLVPILLHTFDILEALHESGTPLKVAELSIATDTSRSTTYRILRTLAYRGYVAQDLEGRFSIADSFAKRVVSQMRSSHTSLESPQSCKTHFSQDQIIEMISGLLQNLRYGDM